MRSYFSENDLISVRTLDWASHFSIHVFLLAQAEVQQFYSDGSMALHTRSLKYGKVCSICLNIKLFIYLCDCSWKVDSL
jgi:hypothetical protein